jgi:hypothetical protein
MNNVEDCIEDCDGNYGLDLIIDHLSYSDSKTIVAECYCACSNCGASKSKLFSREYYSNFDKELFPDAKC